MKNFPSREELVAEVAPAEVEWTELTYFWLATVWYRFGPFARVLVDPGGRI